MMETTGEETPRVRLVKISVMRILAMRYPMLSDGEIFKRAITHIDAMLEAMEAPESSTAEKR